jgi:hypothetical protein
VLTHLKERGPALQQEISARTERLVAALSAAFARAGAPIEVRHFASVWRTVFVGDHPQGDLLYYLVRDGGVHLYEGFPCFMTAAHTDADVERIVAAFTAAVAEMQDGEFLPAPSRDAAPLLNAGAPPVPGARLGRDRDGTPAWFVTSPTEPGRFIKVGAL